MQTSNDDCKKIATLLNGRHKRFLLQNLSQKKDYARLFVDYILVRKNESLRLFYEQQNADGHPWYSYDNIEIFDNHPERHPSLLDYASDTNTYPVILDPNRYPDNVARTQHSEEGYYKHIKNKKISQQVNRAQGLD